MTLSLIRLHTFITLWTICSSTCSPYSHDHRVHDSQTFSTDLSPNQPADFYIARADAYFNLISGKDHQGKNLPSNFLKPEYSKFMVRWEWEPWLLLTGKNSGWSEEWELIDSAIALTLPNSISDRKYRFSTLNPFVRAVVDIKFGGSNQVLRIYEEFTFNTVGEITFMEAWSYDDPALCMDAFHSNVTFKNNIHWPERSSIYRLSTLIPGLGAQGDCAQPYIELNDSVGMKKAYQKEKAFNNYLNRESLVRPLIKDGGSLRLEEAYPNVTYRSQDKGVFRLAEFRDKYRNSFPYQFAEQYILFRNNKDITDNMHISWVPANLYRSIIHGDFVRILSAQYDVLRRATALKAVLIGLLVWKNAMLTGWFVGQKYAYVASSQLPFL